MPSLLTAGRGLSTSLIAAAAASAYLYHTQEHVQQYLPSSFTANLLHSLADAKPSGPLSPDEFRNLRLIDKQKITHNTYFYRFELPDGQAANLPVASCLLTKYNKQIPKDDKPKVIVRPYTPVSPPDAKGHLDLVVKAYPEGNMSKHLAEMKVGDSLAFKGPILKYPYKPNIKKEIGMIAGGTGITPMLQVADHILDNPADNTKISLIFANVSEDDIMLRDKIDAVAAKHPNRFKVYYVVDKPKWGGIFWKGGVGYINKDMVASHLPPPSKGTDALIMVCGPPGMMAAISGDKAKDKSQGELTGLLKAMGYTSDQVYKF